MLNTLESLEIASLISNAPSLGLLQPAYLMNPIDPLQQQTSNLSGNSLLPPATIGGTLDSTDLTNPTRSGRFCDDYLLANVLPGQQVQVNLNADFDTYLQLINADTGKLLAYNDDFGGTLNSQLNFTVQSGVDYILRVSSYAVGVTGGYSLITDIGSPLAGTSISDNQNINGTLASTDLTNDLRPGSLYDGYYLTDLVTGQQVRLNLSSSEFDTYLQLVNADTGTVLAENDDSNGSLNSEITFTAEAGVRYMVRATSYGSDATGNYLLTTSYDLNGIFTSFNAIDASGDLSASTVFDEGALRFSYSLANAASIADVRLEAWRDGAFVSNLGSWTGASVSNQLINLASFSSITAGEYELYAVATTITGQQFLSASRTLDVLAWTRSNGSFIADTLNYSASLGTGALFLGRGGTDTLEFSGVYRNNITSINGMSLSAFNPLSNSTANQAIFGGTAFDYLTLTDGREIYFQGIENLRFADGTNLELQVHPDDSFFGQQWNLHVSDVDSAWRFTQGASDVLLVSLDTGILPTSFDIETSRLIADSTTDNSFNSGHGHQAISVMASTGNNASGVAGINWNSSVRVSDVYSGISLQQAIQDAIAYARANNQRIVFQGGIQGEYWLNSGGTQAQLEQLLQDNSDIAFFAVAAGNGNQHIDSTSNPVYSAGVARLQSSHNNVLAVGALQRTGTTVNGLANATNVNRAGYSNYGTDVLMAATDSPAMNADGSMSIFTGTSCANPNMAGIASLVWSVNSNLDGGQLRQILIDTAMDLGTTGSDNTFGRGLVNADAAVRRAFALNRNSDLANLYSGSSLFV